MTDNTFSSKGPSRVKFGNGSSQETWDLVPVLPLIPMTLGDSG